MLHGPGASAERPSHKRSRKQLDAGKAYWKERIAKLNKQRPEAVSDVLRGVVVYFEGYTDDVTSFQLKKLVYSHGGDICHYFSKSRTTHIVCTNLCDSKAQRVGQSVKGVRVVHPDWLRLSCSDGKKLPEDKFLIVKDQTMKSIDSFFQRKEPLLHRPPAKRRKGDGEEKKNESEPLPLAVVEQPEAAEDCDDGKGEETKGKEKEEKETENERAKNEREDEAETVKKERRRQSQPSQILHEPQPSRKKSRARSSAPNHVDTAPPSTTTTPSSSSLPLLHPTPSIDIPRPAPSPQRSAGMATMPRAASRPSAPPHRNLTPPAALTPLAPPEPPLVSLRSPPPLLPSRPLTPSPPKPKKPPRKPVDRTSLHRFSPNKSFVDQFPSAHTLPFD